MAEDDVKKDVVKKTKKTEGLKKEVKLAYNENQMGPSNRAIEAIKK